MKKNCVFNISAQLKGKKGNINIISGNKSNTGNQTYE